MPDAVLKSALRKIDFVTHDATGNYCVIGEKIRVDGALKKYRNLAETAEISVSEQLISFIEETKDYVILNFEIPRLNTYEIKQFGIFENSSLGSIMYFYSYGDLIYKLNGMNLLISYKIKRTK